jgi:hypothetical protein
VVLRGVDPKLRVLDLVVGREKKPLQRKMRKLFCWQNYLTSI